MEEIFKDAINHVTDKNHLKVSLILIYRLLAKELNK